MIALRADDDVDCRCTADDLFALGLGHATRNRDHHSAPFPGRRLFERAHAAQFGIDFFHLRGWPLVHVLAGLALKGNGPIGSMMVSINRKSVRAFPRWMRAPILSWATLSLVQGGTAAQMVAEFYRGKTIKMVISTTAG